ncbi:thiamine phosphate synthase [Halobacillus litoralis]|uniref:thiamine phosphate synthase n=1 Tax=Halobacillus litoralis TaxID=45668 RepID=UPI00248F5F2E|nr:thiamine phosphate synthase [Halobacillus litoralis]
MKYPERLRKYLVMGSQDCLQDPSFILEEAIRGGVTAFQFREKGKGSLTGIDKYHLGRKLRDICWKHEVLFFVNDDFDLFRDLDADGIHLGQEDMHVEEVRRAFPSTLIGLSISDERELEKAPVTLVDYLGVGPVFSTSTKEDADPVVGTDLIEHVKAVHPHLPLVGIGGINEENAHEVLSAGADGVAVVSAITQAENIRNAVKSL